MGHPVSFSSIPASSYYFGTFRMPRRSAREHQHACLVHMLLLFDLGQGAVGHALAPFDDVVKGDDAARLVRLGGDTYMTCALG